MTLWTSIAYHRSAKEKTKKKKNKERRHTDHYYSMSDERIRLLGKMKIVFLNINNSPVKLKVSSDQHGLFS